MLLYSSIPTPFNCWCHKMTASYTVCLKTQTNNSFKFLLNYGENNIWSYKLVTVKLAFTLIIFFFKCIWILTHVENKSIVTNHYYNNTSFYNCLCTYLWDVYFSLQFWVTMQCSFISTCNFSLEHFLQGRSSDHKLPQILCETVLISHFWSTALPDLGFFFYCNFYKNLFEANRRYA